MCGRYNFDSDDDNLFDILNALNGQVFHTGEIFPTNSAPVLVSRGNFLTPEVMSWGFPQFGGRSGVIINARAETALEKKMFQKAVIERRCVIPSSGFYEWKHDKTKQKFLFTLPEKSALYMAGIFGEFNGVKKYVILTTEPNKSIADVHNRMPLVIEKSNLLDWVFNNEAAVKLLHQTPPELIRRAVS